MLGLLENPEIMAASRRRGGSDHSLGWVFEPCLVSGRARPRPLLRDSVLLQRSRSGLAQPGSLC